MIWWIGTTRRLAVRNDVDGFIPAAALPYLEITSDKWSDIYGDFTVCPTEPDVPGHMRDVCVADAKNLIVQGVTNHRPPFHVWSTWTFVDDHQRDAPENGSVGLTCDASDDAIRNSTIDLDVGTVQLHDGHGSIARPDSRDVEWAVDVKQAIRFGRDNRFLLVVVTANHEAGTGAHDSVFVYTCRGDRIVSVFWAKKEYGATVQAIADGFTVKSGAWSDTDAHCCPSFDRVEQFAWNQSQNRFVRTSNRLTQRRR